MVAIAVVMLLIAVIIGMGISICAFGTGGKRAKVFEDIYFSVEDVNDMGIIYTKGGDYTAILKIRNPIRKYSASKDSYYDFISLFSSILQLFGEGYALHKQDVFVRKQFDMNSIAAKGKSSISKRFLSDSYFRFFHGRSYVAHETFLMITRKGKKGTIHSYDPAKWKDFLVKIQKVHDRLKVSNVECSFLKAEECKRYADRFFAMDFKNATVSMSDFKVTCEEIGMGKHHIKAYSLLDVDQVGLPGMLRPYSESQVGNSILSEDLLSSIDSLPEVDTLVYNQVIFLPNQKREIMKLDKKKNRHASIPNPNNQIAVEDIEKVQSEIVRNGKMLVYAHYNMVVKISGDKDFQKITNSLENLFARHSIHISKRAYNQLELFVGSFPGNCFRLNKEYDRFLTLSEPALCLMYKEHQQQGDSSPLKCYYTDRQGLPLPIDITGKEGKVKYTNNSNFFVLGPSGSGKSFFMNSVMRQYYEQDTDVVIVDTGDSYEGICNYFGGSYISYSKEKPISMNPFKISELEYPSKIEDTVINQTITEYYEAYFHPFGNFSKEERRQMKEILLLEDKKNGKYDQYEKELEDRYEQLSEEKDMTSRNSRLVNKLQAVVEDTAATEGEKQAALHQLQRLTPELVEKNYLQRIERKIDKIERQKRSLKVSELSFNTYYEFALVRIPQLIVQQKIEFAIHDFAAILKPFYKGGERSHILNNDLDATLFDEKFIVFEIDKVKDDPILFPIIVLIIMDVFTQKMRIKKGRKCLVIEEAWKAIATPVMASYIKYLYKTARKHWAMVGVVTQEIQDITSSPIVKEAIINNSDVFMLLDQSKFKDKFSEIQSTLALTDNDCQKIFTINGLDNKEGRSPFMEVFIKRGLKGDVFGVEEPPECYMVYTTEKQEKEALKLYMQLLHSDYRTAVETFVRDWKLSGITKSLDFSRKVLKERKVFNYKHP